MKEKMSVCKSIRLTPAQHEKTAELARNLGIKRNQVFGVLIEHAQVISRPQVCVVVAGNVAPVTEEQGNVHL